VPTPLSYNIHCISISVAVDNPVNVPEALLHQPPNRYELVPKSKQGELSGIVDTYSTIAAGAFRYWLTVLRWKSRIGHIGEPEIRYAGQKTDVVALRSRDTGHRFWLPSIPIVIPQHGIVTEEHWKAAQLVLSSGQKSPVWIEFLFDSEQRLNNADIVGAILSLANRI
jgi:hypothetical protein